MLLALGLMGLTFLMMFLITLDTTTNQESFKMEEKCSFCEDNYATGFMNGEPICDECAMTE